jgi:hypothetical protein
VKVAAYLSFLLVGAAVILLTQILVLPLVLMAVLVRPDTYFDALSELWHEYKSGVWERLSDE